MLETMKEKPIQSQNSTTDALPETPRVDIEVPETHTPGQRDREDQSIAIASIGHCDHLDRPSRSRRSAHCDRDDRRP